MMKRIKLISGTAFAIMLLIAVNPAFTQERLVKVDFESGSFVNTPVVPFDQPFIIQGDAGIDIEYVVVHIFNENSKKPIHSFAWNRTADNNTSTFSVVIPGVLKSGSKYDFQITTYKQMSEQQKHILADNLAERITFFLKNNYYFDGKNLNISNPNSVYSDLKTLIDEALIYQISKNSIGYAAPSILVLEELKNQSDFRFKRFLRSRGNFERDSVADQMVNERVKHINDLIMSELHPFISSDLVQHHRTVLVRSVSTDREQFTLPVNIGMYAWDKSMTINNASVHNVNFTPGAGVTIPFSNRSRLASRSRLFDSFGYSIGLLFEPVADADGTEFVTPGVTLPVYTGLGFRLFKVVRFNAGVIILGEKGTEDFSNLSVLPTAGLSLELNIWLGLKK
ncbi:MAG: hypothetical protein LC649_07510 [Bacteroidales bacterium]|nr:hypothetical protein [Bacteroidales bacterium]